MITFEIISVISRVVPTWCNYPRGRGFESRFGKGDFRFWHTILEYIRVSTLWAKAPGRIIHWYHSRYCYFARSDWATSWWMRPSYTTFALWSSGYLVLTSTIIFTHFEPGRLAKSFIDIEIKIPDPQGQSRKPYWCANDGITLHVRTSNLLS